MRPPVDLCWHDEGLLSGKRRQAATSGRAGLLRQIHRHGFALRCFGTPFEAAPTRLAN
jgi:hypothetical protein